MSKGPMECRCRSRRVQPHGCVDSRALGLSPGQFNTLAAWPDDDEQRLYGSSAALVSPQFQVARQTAKILVQRGWAEKAGRKSLRITELGREMQARIHATEHWQRTG